MGVLLPHRVHHRCRRRQNPVRTPARRAPPAREAAASARRPRGCEITGTLPPLAIFTLFFKEKSLFSLFFQPCGEVIKNSFLLFFTHNWFPNRFPKQEEKTYESARKSKGKRGGISSCGREVGCQNLPWYHNSCGIHALRHTFASMLFSKGVGVKIVSKLLGHSSVKITYDTYVHLFEKDVACVTEVLD